MHSASSPASNRSDPTGRPTCPLSRHAPGKPSAPSPTVAHHLSTSDIFSPHMTRLLTLLVLLATLSFTKSHAQFDAGTGYLAAGLSNFNLNYTDKGGIRAGINIDGGYFLADCLMARASFGYNHYSKHDDAVTLGAGLRYYIIQNGLSIGTGAEFSHHAPNINNLHIPLELGYTFYLNHYVAIEPQVFYKVSVNDFTGGSEVGMRLGLGYYF